MLVRRTTCAPVSCAKQRKNAEKLQFKSNGSRALELTRCHGNKKMKQQLNYFISETIFIKNTFS